MLRDGLERQFLARADVARAAARCFERDVAEGRLTPTAAAGRLLALLGNGPARIGLS